jgi:hypothetical protein
MVQGVLLLTPFFEKKRIADTVGLPIPVLSAVSIGDCVGRACKAGVFVISCLRLVCPYGADCTRSSVRYAVAGKIGAVGTGGEKLAGGVVLSNSVFELVG